MVFLKKIKFDLLDFIFEKKNEANSKKVNKNAIFST